MDPAIAPHPTVAKAMRSNWYGLLGPRASAAAAAVDPHRRPDRASPARRCDDNGVPYSLTEEFVAVYRMHPLLPDEMALADGAGAGSRTRTMTDVTGPAARQVMESHGLADLIASFGHMRPGMLALHNYPDTLRDLERPTAGSASERRIDLAAVDVVRDRERGIPRYNDFRRMLRMAPSGRSRS